MSWLVTDGAQDRSTVVDGNFIRAVRGLVPLDRPRDPSPLDRDTGLCLFRAQVRSRHLDFIARSLRVQGRGFYTIGSSGHEGNAAVAHALRVTDPALLHYRAGAFVLVRADQANYLHAVRDVVLGLQAARAEPLAGGRHKVWGNVELSIPPQTSTIASHLPKAVGMARALSLRSGWRAKAPFMDPPDDAIVMCSFGDASLNHSTAQGALNTAAHLSYDQKAVPVLFVCEDNNIGVSVPTPAGWIESSMRGRPGLRYFAANGLDLADGVAVARAAVDHVRETRRPAFLHLASVRLMGHAGSDVELSYAAEKDIRLVEARDPLIATASLLVESGLASREEVLDEYEAARREVADVAAASDREGLRDSIDVMWPIAPRDLVAISETARALCSATTEGRRAFWQGTLPEEEGPLPLAAHINRALGDLLHGATETLVFGQDVGRKGGIYGVTRRLWRLAPERVLDMLLDEQWILGLAIGAGHLGFLAIAEIQYLAFFHHAADQIRGEASTLQFFSQGAFQNPFILRLPSYGYQKGFGGHFHNDDSVAALLDIPGLIIASPSRGDDAAGMLRTCAAAARAAGSISIFLEPIALYYTSDLHGGDGAWSTPYRPSDHVALGRARIYGEGTDLLLVSFANGVRMSLRVAADLAKRGIQCQVLDLRWLAPLPIEDILQAAAAFERVLIVDETRATGGVSERIITLLHEREFPGRVRRVASKDSFVPLGPAATHVLLSEAEVTAAALALITDR